MRATPYILVAIFIVALAALVSPDDEFPCCSDGECDKLTYDGNDEPPGEQKCALVAIDGKSLIGCCMGVANALCTKRDGPMRDANGGMGANGNTTRAMTTPSTTTTTATGSTTKKLAGHEGYPCCSDNDCQGMEVCVRPAEGRVGICHVPMNNWG